MRRNRVLIKVVGICALVALTAVVLWPQPGPAAASHVAAVSAGGLHTCAVTTSGGVQCWGSNLRGQLGDGTLVDSTIPVDVIGLETGVVAIASGSIHTCALTTEGGVQCWGTIDSPSTSNSSTSAVPVGGLETGVSAITGGFNRACALTTSGGVKCWGYNYRGGLGDGTTTSSETPVDVLEEPDGAPLSDAVAIAAGGDYHTCVLTTLGGVKCWGYNEMGQLGCGTNCGSGLAVAVVGLETGVAAVASGGGHTCALLVTGGMQCWGYNSNGQLGNGEIDASFAPHPTPQDVVGLDTGVAAISPGILHTCALLVSGGVKCWGMNFFGQLGAGTSGPGTDRPVPVDVLGLSSGVVAVSAGLFHTCALTDTGAVTCWGANNYGNFGQTGDSDGDGCTDFVEHGTNAALGGRRDHLDYWDFFDTPDAGGFHDRRIDAFDIGAVVVRFGAVGDPEGDPLAPPPPAPAYHTAFDRGGSIPGENVWNLLPADGSINAFDIGAMIAQFGHICV